MGSFYARHTPGKHTYETLGLGLVQFPYLTISHYTEKWLVYHTEKLTKKSEKQLYFISSALGVICNSWLLKVFIHLVGCISINLFALHQLTNNITDSIGKCDTSRHYLASCSRGTYTVNPWFNPLPHRDAFQRFLQTEQTQIRQLL